MSVCCSIAVHPHACGEHYQDIGRCVEHGGSSPRLWGTPVLAHRVHLLIRFIPTLVGNTTPDSGPILPSSVHPHACGEHNYYNVSLLLDCGSSPRLWGTLSRYWSLCRAWRFIPTLVGNTGSGTPRPPVNTVHPHACGEHYTRFRAYIALIGSSPRLWGTPMPAPYDSEPERFIPTLVGNTSSSRLNKFGQAVHPHACGEHLPIRMSTLIARGSSPRLWGTLC